MNFNKIIARFESNLKKDLPNHQEYIQTISTQITNDLKQLTDQELGEIEKASMVSLEDRIQELGRYDELINLAYENNSKITGNQMACLTTYRNYMQFVYLNDNCFKVTRKVTKDRSLTKRICKILTDNPIRSLRNAIAHGNFNLNEDYSISYYAHKESGKSDKISEFDVSKNELEYWQELSRTTAYTIYGYIVQKKKLRIKN